ncbi:hypothetical protein ABTM75_20210, partial [Acinetobacter baumannii]
RADLPSRCPYRDWAQPDTIDVPQVAPIPLHDEQGDPSHTPTQAAIEAELSDVRKGSKRLQRRNSLLERRMAHEKPA